MSSSQKVGILPDAKDAEQFAYFLNRQGIEHELKETIEGIEVYIHHSAHIPIALKALEEVNGASKEAVIHKIPLGPMTLFFITLCVSLYVLQYLGLQELIYNSLMMSKHYYGIQEINNGQIWRLLTPIFLHSPASLQHPENILHIVFNMMWLYQLGPVIEANEDSKRFVLLVVVIGLVSNYAQYLSSGPAFFGMSGVIYGLLGYLWYLSQFARHKTSYYVSKQLMLFMVVWLLVCFTGWVGNIANTAHVVGLLTGIIFGALAASIWPEPKHQN